MRPADRAAVRAALERAAGVDFRADFHALPSSAVAALLDAADRYGYRTPRNASGSRARCFFQFLTRGV